MKSKLLSVEFREKENIGGVNEIFLEYGVGIVISLAFRGRKSKKFAFYLSRG